MRRATTIRLTAILLAAGLLAACGDDRGTGPTTTSEPAVAGESPVVTGGFGETPTIALPDGVAGDELVVEMLEAGDGDEVVEGQVIVADYQAMVWAGTSTDETTSSAEGDEGDEDGETDGDGAKPLFDTFTSGRPETFTMADGQVLPGMHDALVGATVGSRVLAVIPPAEGFGEAGQPNAGIKPTDTLVFVFDVLASFEGDQAAEGTEVTPEAGLPTVAEGDAGPTASMPTTAPPTELVTQVLVKGDGPEVETGQLLVAQYRGQLYKDGTEFDSSWKRSAPSGFPIGVGGVIPGWDKGLVGQTVGSRVLLVIPPADGYGEAGNPPAIAGDDTLVFVVDILGAYGEPTE